jgi:uncharacterized membrane protein YczE
MRENHTTAELRRRLPRLLLGLVLCGLGIALMVAGDLGLGPWDVLHQGISQRTGIPIGMVSIGVGALVMLLWLPLRERPGLGTVCNVVLIGVVIDVTLLWLHTPESMLLRGVMMLSGPVFFGIGSGFYIGAGLGPGPRDGVMTGLARRGPAGRGGPHGDRTVGAGVRLAARWDRWGGNPGVRLRRRTGRPLGAAAPGHRRAPTEGRP